MSNEVKIIETTKRNGKPVLTRGIWKWGPLFNTHSNKQVKNSSLPNKK